MRENVKEPICDNPAGTHRPLESWWFTLGRCAKTLEGSWRSRWARLSCTWHEVCGSCSSEELDSISVEFGFRGGGLHSCVWL